MIGPAHGNLSVKRLVIFGCGYVGGELARQAVARGVRVTALTRNEEKAAVLRAAGVEVVVAELASAGWHARLAGGAEWAVNCVSSGGGGLEGYRRSYVEGATAIAAWARARGQVGTMLYTGSTSVYPQGGGVRVDESSTTDGGGERAQILLEAERVVREAQGSAWARAFVLRLAGIYGPGRHHLLEQVRAGEVAGRGDFHLNLIFRDDICAAIWAALTAPATVEGGTFNIADDGAAPKAEIVAWLAARLGKPTPPFTGEPAAGRREVTPDRVIVNARAKAVLGWAPQFPTFREGYENLLSR
jgi:nucleoside-diphosphate-sugar epimerase